MPISDGETFGAPSKESRETPRSADGTEGRTLCQLPWSEHRKLHLYNILYMIATIIGILTILLNVVWGLKYCGGYSLNTIWTEVNWHPLLMIVGFTFLYAQAFLFDQTGKNLPRWCGTFIPRSYIFWFSLIIKIICYIIVGLGLYVAFDFGNFFQPKKPHIYTLHAWIGIGSVIFLSLDIILDFKWFFLDKISDFLRDFLIAFSWFVSTMAFVMSINSSITGFMEDALFMFRENYADLAGSAIFLNSIACLILLFSVIVLHLSRKMRKVGNFEDSSRNVQEARSS